MHLHIITQNPILPVNTPDKHTLPHLLPLAVPSSAITMASLLNPDAPPSHATVNALANAAAFAPPFVHGPQQGSVTRWLGARPAHLELLRATRKAYESNPVDHRIVDRAYCMYVVGASECVRLLLLVSACVSE